MLTCRKTSPGLVPVPIEQAKKFNNPNLRAIDGFLQCAVAWGFAAGAARFAMCIVRRVLVNAPLGGYLLFGVLFRAQRNGQTQVSATLLLGLGPGVRGRAVLQRRAWKHGACFGAGRAPAPRAVMGRGSAGPCRAAELAFHCLRRHAARVQVRRSAGAGQI